MNRLQYEEKVIKASEHWKDDKALPLPAQFMRLGADLVAEKTESFSYALLSLWPVNKQNAPVTAGEKTGLQHVVDHPDETLLRRGGVGRQDVFYSRVPGQGHRRACVTCHNNHKDSPRSDFKLNDIMGGIVIRIPLQGVETSAKT